MASSWGSWVATDDWRCGVNAWISSQTDTQVTVTVQCVFDNVYLYGSSSSNGNVIRTSCNGSNSDENISLGTKYGHYRNAVVKTSTYTLNRGSGSAYNASFGAAVYVGASTYRAWSSASVTLTIPCRAYYTPRPPKDAAAARVSDTSQKLTWKGDYTGMDGGYPWANVYVDRKTDDGDWSKITTLNWDAVNYTDGGTSLGHKYEYGLRSYGAGGTSSRATAGTLYTTPAAYGAVSVAKTDDGVQLTWSTVPNYITATDVERSTDNWKTSEVPGKLTVSDEGALDADPPAGSVRYRVRGALYCGTELLSGEWTYTDEIVTITPPNAPTVATLSAAYATGTDVTVKWTPNHPDRTAQSSAQVEVVYNGESTAYDIEGATAQHVISSAANGSYQVRVRTKGADPDWGEWSSYAVFIVAAVPALTISSPKSGATIGALPLTVSWTVSDDTGVSRQTVTVSDSDGGIMETRTVDPGTTTADFGAVLGFANDSSYRVTVEVMGGSSLTKSRYVTVKTHWIEPTAPSITVTEVDGLGLAVAVDNTGEGIDSVSFSVVRVTDGERKVLETAMLPGHQTVDRLPPLNIDFAYEITGTAESGSVVTVQKATNLDSDGMEAFNFGADASQGIGLGYNASDSEGVTMSGTSFHFALGSDASPLPTFYPDGDMDVTGSHTYSIYRKEGYLRLRSLVRDPSNAVCWYRSAFGRRARCYVTWSLSYAASSYSLFEVSANVTEVVWEEPEA